MANQSAVEVIKENKKKIFDLICSFSESIKKKECKAEILNVFHKLSFYSSEIFIGEELIMKKYQYSSISEHINEHKNL